MKKIAFTALVFSLMSCSSQGPTRLPAAEALNIGGTYMGEGLYNKRPRLGKALRRPAIRLYLHPIEGEFDSYYGVLLEYDHLEKMALPYLSSQKAPALNKLVGYLDKIATEISAYKVSPAAQKGSYEMRNLTVVNGAIQPAAESSLTLTLSENRKSDDVLGGAKISGDSDGDIHFPAKDEKSANAVAAVRGALSLSQYELGSFTYKKAHLASTWRGDWSNLVGSYLSEYGRYKDGVLELYSEGAQNKAKFIKSKKTKAKYFTNPKSANLQGEYVVTEPVKDMFLMSPAGQANAEVDRELTGRIGLFLDVFDGSAPEAGSHLVVELALINPQDPSDFMMYYEHPEHLKNIGVEGGK